MAILGFLLDHSTVIGLAMLGAVIATLGNHLLRRPADDGHRVARFVLRTGYAITWASVALFIAAGFASGR